MSARESAPPGKAQSHKVRNTLLGLLVLAAVVLIGLFAWGVRRYDRLVAAGKRIEDRYAMLGRQFRFEPPAAGTTPDPRRIERMLAARARLIEALPPRAGGMAKRSRTGAIPRRA